MANLIDFPNKISAGVNFVATAALPDFQPPAWSLAAVIRGAGAIDIDAIVEDGIFKMLATAAETAAWTPGRYWVSLRASKDDDIYEVARFQVDVTPDLVQFAEGFDGRSQNEIALDAINAVIAKRATIDQQRYTINNRELWRTSITDLLKLKSFYTTAVRRERRRAAGQSAFGRRIDVRFSQ